MISRYTAVGCVSFPNFGSLRVGVNLVGDNAFLGLAVVGAESSSSRAALSLSVGAAAGFTSILIASLVGTVFIRSRPSPSPLLIGALFGSCRWGA